MNILQILPQLNVGGVETGTVDLTKWLARQGHRCVVISSGGGLVSQLEACGIRHVTLPVHKKAFWVMLKAAKEVTRIIREEKIDIVHARSRVPAWIGFMGARPTQAVFLTTAHGHYSRHIFSPMMGWGKFVIVPSAVIGKHMMEDFGVPLENIRMIPRSVDLERYPFRGFKSRKKGQEFLVGVIGRVTPIKGQIYFLKALACALRSLPQIKAWIVGGISPGKDHYMEELEVWARRLGLNGVVRFLGNRQDIPEVLGQLDCLVMPSIAEESFGRVIVEAQAIGVPVVATKVGGVVEVIADQKNGVLVHPKDHDALAEGMLKVLTDEPFARGLVDEGRKNVEEKYSLESMARATLRVYEEAAGAPRILVIKLSAIGDAILAVPSFKALKNKFPAARIACLVGKDARDVFARCPYIDELIVCDFKDKDRGLKGFGRVAKKLFRRRFDMCVDFQNNKISHMLGYATGANRRYGYDNGKMSFLLNKKVKDNAGALGPVAHQFRVLGMLGISYADEALELWPSEDDSAAAVRVLREQGWKGEPLVGLNIGASPRWQSKRWPARHIMALCEMLEARGARVVLTGSAVDAAVAERILKRMKARPYCAVARTTLMQLAALIKHCDVYVTGDSAPMHVAAAMKVPFVALFGPTDAARHLPPGGVSLVLQKDCRPCYKDVCRRKTHVCMEAIRPEDVADAVEKLMRGSKSISK